MSTRGESAVAKSLLEDLEGILAEAQPEELDEAAKKAAGGKAKEKKAREKRKARKVKRNPFLHKTTLGPGAGGPYTGKKTVRKKTGKWRCKGCSGYGNCLCVKKSETTGKLIKKKIKRMSRKYIKDANKVNKEFARKQRNK
jgi:hypothetical protein